MMGSPKYFGVVACLCILVGLVGVISPASAISNFTDSDLKNIANALNLEYFEAEYFLWASYGFGLDKLAPSLTGNGPKPIGVQKANLDAYYTDVFQQMGLQEIGHIRAIKEILGKYKFPRVQLDVSKATWAETMDKAFGKKLNPPFDPYANSVNYLISTYTIPYVGLTGYVGTIPLLKGMGAKSLVAKLLGVESGQDAVIRTEMYRMKDKVVAPYNYTVADFSNAISNLRNSASHAFVDEGLVVPSYLGAEKKISGNILSADGDSLSYARTAAQVLATVYGSGDPSKPGGFYPEGACGPIAESYLKKEDDE